MRILKLTCENKNSVLLQYGTVLQPFKGVMTFVMIFTNLRAHSLFPYNCNGVDLSSLCVYKATVMSRCVSSASCETQSS